MRSERPVFCGNAQSAQNASPEQIQQYEDLIKFVQDQLVHDGLICPKAEGGGGRLTLHPENSGAEIPFG
ncbi:MAG: hypothetical protein KA436_11930 [Oligoflexales bacterium]|nr:hypothetical protein [Oligoflexales bacterium]